MPLRWVAIACLFTLAALGAAQDRVSPSEARAICATLAKRLRIKGLRGSAPALRKKLGAIGQKTGKFQIDVDVDPQYPVRPYELVRVKGPDPEWVALLTPEADETAAYWIGIRNGRVVAQALPSDEDEMIGPLLGEWRRNGPYLVGVGLDDVYHSPAWAEAEFDVFIETAKGLRRIQQSQVGQGENPFGFRSDAGMDLVCAERSGKDSFHTIEETRHTGPIRESYWKFQDGHYVPNGSAIQHDEAWAADRLMTALGNRDTRTLQKMIPDEKKRQTLLKRLRDAYHHEAFRPEMYEHIVLGSRTFPDYELDLDLEQQGSQWVLKDAVVEHVTEDS